MSIIILTQYINIISTYNIKVLKSTFFLVLTLKFQPVFYGYSTSQIRLVSFKVLSGHMWPVATTLDGTDHNRMLCLCLLPPKGSYFNVLVSLPVFFFQSGVLFSWNLAPFWKSMGPPHQKSIYSLLPWNSTSLQVPTPTHNVMYMKYLPSKQLME